MGGKRVLITQCMEGDIAASDVTNEHGVTVIVKDTILNPYIIKKLQAFGVTEVSVYDSQAHYRAAIRDNPEFLSFADDYHDSVTGVKQIISGLGAGATADRRLIKQVSDVIYSTIDHAENVVSFIQLLKSTDEYTYTHCINTAYYTMLIGKWMGCSKSELRTLVQAGLLHDIGKVRVPLELLNKQGILTRDEFETIKQHTVWGYQILDEAGIREQEIQDAVLLHHERVDGSGYPFRALAHDLGTYARIVAVADVFDAMTSSRVYKPAATPFEAFEMFTTVGLGIFDPSVVSTFIKNLAANYVGCRVWLTNGEMGKLIYIPPHDVLSPLVSVGDRVIDLASHTLKIAAMV